MAWFETAVTNPRYAISLARRRILAITGHRLSRLTNYRAAMPETINIYPTDRCNLKCNMCFQSLRSIHEELPLTHWDGIFAGIDFKPRIHLSGGEPMLYPGFSELLARVRGIGSHVAITTNGTRLEAFAKPIVDNKINSITISIDGDERTHDKIRGVPGAFKQIIAGLIRLNEIKTGAHAPAVNFNSMINFKQPDTMDRVIELAGKFNVRQVQFIHPLFLRTQDIDAHRKFIREKLNCDLNYWQHADTALWDLPDRAVLEKLTALRHNDDKIRVSVFPDFDREQIVDYYRRDGKTRRSAAGDCRAMWNTATILPSGLLESCPDYVLGNCREHNFKKLWNNERMKDLRRRIKSKKYFSVCRACCFFY